MFQASWKPILDAENLREYADFMRRREMELTQKIPERSICRLLVSERPSPDSIGPEPAKSESILYLKRTHYARLSVTVRALLKWNFPVFSAVQEFQNICLLNDHDFAVPEVIAVGQSQQFWYPSSFLLMRAVAGRTLQWQYQQSSKQERLELLELAAKLLTRLHHCGFIHRDLSAEHLFLDHDRLSLIDCERLIVFEGLPPNRWLAKDIAQFLGSLGIYADNEQWQVFWRLPEMHYALVLRDSIRNRLKRLARKKPQSP